MLSLNLFLVAVAFLAASGVPGCFMGARSRAGQYAGAALLFLGSAAGLVSVATALTVPGMETTLRQAWRLPIGEFFISIDALSAVFLVPVFVLPFLGAFFGLGYWPYSSPGSGGRKLGLFYGLLAGGMAAVAVARDAVLFLAAWELMATSAFFAATADSKNQKAHQSGWIYLVATHAGTLCLFAMFALWKSETGSFALVPAAIMGKETAGAIFVLALAGYGLKAGIVPLHFWLPDFYTHAPSHVSGVLSGIMSKMGIYGLVRMCGLLPPPETWWGGLLLAVGAFTAIAGILFALGQADVKRLLSYSSVENIGVITIGIGLAMLGKSHGHGEWVLLGLGGALFHVWNHGLFKSLLFFSAGTIERATGTRNLSLLGGLGKRLPLTMATFLVGALAISALPPLSGFASEWLIYNGLFRTMGDATGLSMAASAAAALALTGALATAVFVKLFATAFLGSPRSELTINNYKPGFTMAATTVFLAVCCALAGMLPWKISPFLEAAVRAWTMPEQGPARIDALVPLRWLGLSAGLLLAVIAAIALALKVRLRSKPARRQVTWDCGYSSPTSRMQYTGASIASSILVLFPIASPVKKEHPEVAGEFPSEAGFKAELPDTVLDKVVLPAKSFIGSAASRIRFFQQGQLSRYLLYILIATMALLIFGAAGGS